MINKMPVVGKRYLSTRTGWECELKRFNEETATAYDKYGTRLECVATRFWDYFEELPEDNLQETEKATVIFQTPDEPSLGFNSSTWSDVGTDSVDLEKGEVSEVERALEELKREISLCGCGMKPAETEGERRMAEVFYYFLGKAQNLVSALEKERSERAVMSKPEPKIDMKEECVEPVSIWKDLLLGELDVNNDELYLMQYDGGVRLGVVLHHDAIDEYDISIIGKGIYPKIEQKAIHANKCCSLTDFVKSFEQMQKDIEELKRK